MIIEYTSSVRGDESDAPEFPPCCGLPPRKTTWEKGLGKDAVLLCCQNPKCSNHSGVFACDVDIAKKWDSYRKPESTLPN